jgi:hypothetical protein
MVPKPPGLPLQLRLCSTAMLGAPQKQGEPRKLVRPARNRSGCRALLLYSTMAVTGIDGSRRGDEAIR